MKRDPREHGGKRIPGGRWLMAGMCVCVLSSSVFAEPPAPVSDPAFQHRIEEIVQQYIKDHPEVIESSLAALDARRAAEEKDRVRKVIATRQADLLYDPASPVSGNPAGDVTLVEFFDYRCGFCRRVAGAVTELQKDDPNVRVVYKDFPILGEASELAAKGALAAKAQGKHHVFHEAVLATKHEITKDELLRIAGEVGLDAKKLDADMANPEWQAIIDRNRALAKDLGITGTPGFIVGTELVPGALDVNGLKDLIARAGRRE